MLIYAIPAPDAAITQPMGLAAAMASSWKWLSAFEHLGGYNPLRPVALTCSERPITWRPVDADSPRDLLCAAARPWAVRRFLAVAAVCFDATYGLVLGVYHSAVEWALVGRPGLLRHILRMP